MKRKLFVCAACGHVGQSQTKTKGSILIEIVLWCCFLLPGLIYSIWRLTTRFTVCPFCGNSGLIPAASPIGKKLISELQQAAADYSAS